MSKKAVFFDIDGTIYKFAMGIPKDTIESIQALKENGHIPIICTGRTKVMIYDKFLEPGFEHIIGGAGTYIEINGRESFYYEMKKEEIDEIIYVFSKYGFSPVVEGRDFIYVDFADDSRGTRGDKIINNYRSELNGYCKDIGQCSEIKASKASAAFTPHSDLEGVKKELGDRYEVVNHNGNLLELIPKGFSKATGIEFLINKLEISKDDTYAFGDSFNDLEMLQYVKYGIAMGNSHPDLFKFVNYRTDDLDKGGITNALKRFGLIR